MWYMARKNASNANKLAFPKLNPIIIVTAKNSYQIDLYDNVTRHGPSYEFVLITSKNLWKCHGESQYMSIGAEKSY